MRLRRALHWTLANLVLAVLVFGAPTSSAANSFLIGDWYGEGQPDDPNVYWLAHIGSDGRYSALFRFCRGHVASDLEDTGTWTYGGKIVEIVTLTVNGHPVRDTDRYDTLSYDGHKHVYRHERSGYVFTAVRVKHDFELPPCSLSS
jgi:hypothetical protein